MQNNYEVLELFPTPLYTVRIPDYYSSIIPWLYSFEMLEEEVDEVNYGQRSKDSYILNKPEADFLSKFILDEVKNFGNQILNYNYDSYKFSQSWISFKHTGQHHTAHTHPNSLISGVLFFGSSNTETPAIKFHKINGGINASYIKPDYGVRKKGSKFSYETFSINFEPGLMLLFPSYLLHSVPLNKTEQVRCSLAFNTVPVVGFGNERELTELRF